MDSEEALLVGRVKDDQIIDDRISENELKIDNFSDGNCKIITSPSPSRRSDEPTELSFEKSRFFNHLVDSCFLFCNTELEKYLYACMMC